MVAAMAAVARETHAAQSYGPNPQAVREVEQGKRTTATASWWGFNPEDSTDALQKAIDSGARDVIVPNVGRPWVVGPIRLASGQRIVFERGVVVLAKAGAFRGRTECLFKADCCRDLAIEGYGAKWVMRKTDYHHPPYQKAEWRHCLSLLSCENVKVEGLTLADSGGDGIYIGRSHKKGAAPWCRNILVRDVVCDGNNRQGISVITAVDLRIEDSEMRNTWGTAPQAGIDFEPNRPDERLSNCVVRRCRFIGNTGAGVLISPHLMKSDTEPISIRIEDCLIRGNAKAAIRIVGVGHKDAVGGTIEMIRNTIEGPVTIARPRRISLKTDIENVRWR